LARIDEQDIIGHEREQAGEIAGVSGVDPGWSAVRRFFVRRMA